MGKQLHSANSGGRTTEATRIFLMYSSPVHCLGDVKSSVHSCFYVEEKQLYTDRSWGHPAVSVYSSLGLIFCIDAALRRGTALWRSPKSTAVTDSRRCFC